MDEMSIGIRDKSPKTYGVIGASNSATSFISKMLEDAGVKMHNSKAGWHEKFYEDARIRRLNSEILKRAGGDLGHPPLEKDVLAVDMDDEIRHFVKRRRHNMWGFKDPQTALVGKKWLPFLKDDVYLICVFRKPERVLRGWARSNRPKGVKDKRRVIDETNKSILSIIKEFCEL